MSSFQVGYASSTKLALWHPLLSPFIKSLCLLFVPYLLGFVFKSYEILRCSALRIREFEACAVLPIPNETEPPQTPRNGSKSLERLTHEIFLMLQLLLFLELGALQWIVPMDNFIPPQFTQILLNITACCMFTTLVFAVLRSAFQMRDIIASQISQSTERGGELVENLNLSIIFFFVSVVIGSSQNDTFCVCVVALALVYFASGGRMGKMRGWRHMFGFWAYHSLGILAVVYSIRQSLTKTQSQDEEDIWPATTFQSLYISFLPTVISSYYSGTLIVRMLRYDFTNHVDELKPCIDKAGEPREMMIALGTSFPKPYFTVAIVAWSFIRIATIILCLTTGFPFKSPYDACFVAVVIEFPTMMAAVFLSGVFRGKAKNLWNYEERWSRKPSNPVHDTIAKTNDEKVQSY